MKKRKKKALAPPLFITTLDTFRCIAYDVSATSVFSSTAGGIAGATAGFCLALLGVPGHEWFAYAALGMGVYRIQSHPRLCPAMLWEVELSIRCQFFIELKHMAVIPLQS